MQNVSSATRTVNALRLGVKAGQLTTELTARATPVVDDVISMSDAQIATVNASTALTDPNRRLLWLQKRTSKRFAIYYVRVLPLKCPTGFRTTAATHLTVI